MWKIVYWKKQYRSLRCGRMLNQMNQKILTIMVIFFLSLYLLNARIKILEFNNQIKLSSESIGLFIVADSEFSNLYKQHLASLTCYAHRHSYRFILMDPKQYPICANISQSVYFRKHCLVSMYLLENARIQWLLILDIDVLVLNMSKKIESYLPKTSSESSIYMILYERFNGEIAAGNYIIHNHPWSHAFLARWIEYERYIPFIKFHNSDNGVLHIHLLDDMVGNVSQSKYKRCFDIYKSATEHIAYHTYVGCCKCALDGRWEFKHLRILRRGHSFVRDNLGYEQKKRIWSPTDFLLHGQKKNVHRYYSDKIDKHRCKDPQWILPVREDATFVNYTELKEVVGQFDRAAAQAYPQSVGLPDISDCWPYCTENETRRQAFLDKVCNVNASWRSFS